RAFLLSRVVAKVAWIVRQLFSDIWEFQSIWCGMETREGAPQIQKKITDCCDYLVALSLIGRSKLMTVFHASKATLKQHFKKKLDKFFLIVCCRKSKSNLAFPRKNMP